VIQPADWPEVAGVPSWLEAIWWHLLSNALQHNESSTRIELGWERAGEHQRFWTQNIGPSISVSKRMKLFQPFYQLHETDARKGLGLSIVQRLVQLQGGASDYEAGSEGNHRFIFTLPVPTRASSAKRDKSPSPRSR
jgi:signal transduction histidine kinase